MSITYFEFFGERCSGTNFLEEAMLNNFHLTYKNEGRNKHFFCFNKYDKSYDNTLFIGIVRNPIYWLNSYHVELHNIPKENRKNIKSFLFNPFYSVDKLDAKNSNFHFMFNKEYTIQEDLNYITGGKYKNIFELRKLKNDYLMNILPKKVKNYILINYEDLLYNYQETLSLLRDTFKLKQKHETFQKIVKYKKSTYYNFVKQREILLPSIIISVIWNNLDLEQEKKLGYTQGNDNSNFINKYKNTVELT
jgi:hypothetical protein